MCTAATYKTKDFYFGRTLDYEFSYGDEVVITPRNYPFHFRHIDAIESHYAMIGMAHVVNNDPLYYDAFNECGLAMAGLNFVGNAAYYDIEEGKDNIAQFEFIPWILGTCANLEEAKTTLIHMNLTNTPYSEQFPLAQLHWIIADQSGAITVEAMEDGMHIYENNVGVLTNNPPFNIQMFLLNQYMNLSPKQPENLFAKDIDLDQYSRGMGAIGLPGDLSSSSRLPNCILSLEILKMKVSISFSIFLDLSISKEDAVMSMENMRLPYILLVVIRKKESTIIQPMIITRSVLLI